MVWLDTVDRLRSIRLSEADQLRVLASQLLRANVELQERLQEALDNRHMYQETLDKRDAEI